MSQIFTVRSLKGTDSTLKKKRTFPGMEIRMGGQKKWDSKESKIEEDCSIIEYSEKLNKNSNLEFLVS